MVATDFATDAAKVGPDRKTLPTVTSWQTQKVASTHTLLGLRDLQPLFVQMPAPATTRKHRQRVGEDSDISQNHISRKVLQVL
jgi:hypothetical protein